MKVVFLLERTTKLMISSCEESRGLYTTLVCMGKRIVWRNDIGFDDKETGFDSGKGVQTQQRLNHIVFIICVKSLKLNLLERVAPTFIRRTHRVSCVLRLVCLTECRSFLRMDSTDRQDEISNLLDTLALESGQDTTSQLQEIDVPAFEGYFSSEECSNVIARPDRI